MRREENIQYLKAKIESLKNQLLFLNKEEIRVTESPDENYEKIIKDIHFSIEKIESELSEKQSELNDYV